MYVTNLMAPALIATVIGALLAGALYFGLDRFIAKERGPAVAGASNVVRQMRIEAIDEIRIRRIVADACGEYWEEFFEEIFGYSAKRDMRMLLEQERGGTQLLHRHGQWRDRIVDRIASHVDQIRESQQKRRLRTAEAARLRATGIDPKLAAVQAAAETDQALQLAAAMRVSAREYLTANPARRQALRQMVTAARSGKHARKNVLARLSKLPQLVFSGKVRFAAAIALIVCGLAWMQHNHMFEQVNVSSVSELTQIQELGQELQASLASTDKFEPLPYLPEPLASALASMGTVVAGLALMMTAPCAGMKATICSVLAGACALLGPANLAPFVPAFVPNIAFISPAELLAFAIAVALVALAWWVSE